MEKALLLVVAALLAIPQDQDEPVAEFRQAIEGYPWGQVLLAPDREGREDNARVVGGGEMPLTGWWEQFAGGSGGAYSC